VVLLGRDIEGDENDVYRVDKIRVEHVAAFGGREGKDAASRIGCLSTGRCEGMMVAHLEKRSVTSRSARQVREGFLLETG
jgi:hypothetical protein